MISNMEAKPDVSLSIEKEMFDKFVKTKLLEDITKKYKYS
jgi:hypothetical protein